MCETKNYEELLKRYYTCVYWGLVDDSAFDVYYDANDVGDEFNRCPQGTPRHWGVKINSNIHRDSRRVGGAQLGTDEDCAEFIEYYVSVDRRDMSWFHEAIERGRRAMTDLAIRTKEAGAQMIRAGRALDHAIEEARASGMTSDWDAAVDAEKVLIKAKAAYYTLVESAGGNKEQWK